MNRAFLEDLIREEVQAIAERCWDGYERVPNKRAGEQGSCRKKGSVNEEEITDAEEEELKKIKKELEGASKMHKGQADRIGKTVDEGEICDAGLQYVFRTDPGGKDIKRGTEDKDGDGENEIENWSARAAQIASKKCKTPSYGTGKSKKNESLEEAEGGLKAWEKENWVHSDGTPCGSGDKDGSESRCKPKSKWKTMSSKEKKADDAKKKAGTKAGKQYVPATKKGKVTKSHTKRENVNRERLMEIVVEELDGSDYHEEIDALSENEEYCPHCADQMEEAKKKKPCKPSKGKRFAKRVDGKCRSYGQSGQAKGGGDRIRPGTKKGDAYCARSAGIKKCKNPPCANTLSRKKWKCRGKKSMK
tara:strand:+ start:13391 stop:14473 length:1083 start_codon:yes stop_codon:yes gene_type:complete